MFKRKFLAGAVVVLSLLASSASAQDLNSHFSLYNLTTAQSVTVQDFPAGPGQTGNWDLIDNRVLAPGMYEFRLSTDSTGAGPSGVGGATELRFDLNLSNPVTTDGSLRGNSPVEYGGSPIDFLGPWHGPFTIETPTSNSHAHQSTEITATGAHGLLMTRQWGSLNGHDAPGSSLYWRLQVNAPTTFTLGGVVDHRTTPDAPPGSSEDNPHMPTDTEWNGGNPRWLFNMSNMNPANGWFDPPRHSGYEFQAREGLFTSIADFPTDFEQPFTVIVDGNTYGPFEAGDSMDFSSFPGGGVSAFQIANIEPGHEGTYPLGFPIKLNFNTTSPEFTMTPAPEPSGVALLAVAAAALARRYRR